MSSEAAPTVVAPTEPKAVIEEPKPAISEAVSAPAVVEKPTTSESVPESKPAIEETKPAVSASTPLSQLFAELPAIIKDADHNEIWGVQLSDESHVPTAIVLEKFLRANTKDVTKAKAQLIEALKWRKSVDPAKLLAEVEFDSAKFGSLGYVTVYPETGSHGKEIVTWNIYGAVKDNKATFGNVEE